MTATAAAGSATAARSAVTPLLLGKVVLHQIGPQQKRLGVTKILLSCKSKETVDADCHVFASTSSKKSVKLLMLEGSQCEHVLQLAVPQRLHWSCI